MFDLDLLLYFSINFNHLVFNVSPASIYILYNSYQTFMENLSARE